MISGKYVNSLRKRPTAFTEKVKSKLAGFKARWEGSLANQIKDLPEFDLVVRELNKHFRKIK